MEKRYIDWRIERELAEYPRRAECPYCPASVVVHNAAEEAAVKRDGCGLRGCPGRKKDG
jgi:hypothetical protein